MYIKINNFYNNFEQPDYKGIDLKQIITGSQLYPINATYCIISTNQEFTTLPVDIEEITENQYIQEKENIQKSNQQNQINLQQLQNTLAELIKESLN